MKIVIPCAASKAPVGRGDFSGFMCDTDGNPVKFVAEPNLAPKSRELRYVSPDCDYDSSMNFASTMRNSIPTTATLIIYIQPASSTRTQYTVIL